MQSCLREGPLSTYSAYINEFVQKADDNDWRRPGEHHFVATYLLPRLNNLTDKIPYYVNPDGMKDAVGDVLYYRDTVPPHPSDRRKVLASIEVKFLDVRLTAKEFNKGIVARSSERWPTFFLGIGHSGLYVQGWRAFRNQYAELKYGGKIPKRELKAGNYGLLTTVDRLLRDGRGHKFVVCRDSYDAAREEERFCQTLRHLMRAVLRS